MPKKKPSLILVAKVEDDEYKIDLLDLRIRERIALEEYMDAPYLRIQSEGWVISEKVIAFGGYLARRRKEPTATLEEFLDLMDEDKVTVTLGEEKKPARPTRSRKTSGGRSTSKSSG